MQSSLEAGVRVVDRGIADPARIGITGLSDGSTTVEWALIHSSIFSAAAISSCCWDPTFISRVGPSAARHFLAEGYPGILGRNDPFWKDVALEANAERIRTPILVSASEEEFLGALRPTPDFARLECRSTCSSILTNITAAGSPRTGSRPIAGRSTGSIIGCGNIRSKLPIARPSSRNGTG